MRARFTIPAIVMAATVLISGLTLPSSDAGARPYAAPTGVAFFDSATGWWDLPGEGGFYYGIPGDIPLMCDWDGDGTDTVGVYRGSTGSVFLRNSNTQGFSELETLLGQSGDLPICGDWNGDGFDSLGIFRVHNAHFYLTNDNRSAIAQVAFEPRLSGSFPVAGDWNGDGVDTVGLWDPANGRFHVRKSNSDSTRAFTGYYGVAGDLVFTGDWDGDGRDSLAVYRRTTSQLYYSNKLMTSKADGVASAEGLVGIPVGAEWAQDSDPIDLTDASRTHASQTTTTSSLPPASGSSSTTTVPLDVNPTTTSSTTPTTAQQATTTTSSQATTATTTPPAPTTTTTITTPPATTTTTVAPQAPSGSIASVEFLGVPWSGYGIGNRDIDRPMAYYNSVVMPYDGSLAAVQKYFIYPDGYGAGDGGTIQFKVHRDAGGRPGAAVASGITDGALNRDRSNRGHFPVITFDQSVTVTQGERIWISVGNIDPNPTTNYTGMDDLHLAATEPVSPLDPKNRQLTVFDADLNLTPNRQAILVIHYTDGRKWGNGYVMSGPKMGSEYVPIQGSQQVRQTFVPNTDVTLNGELWVRLVRQNGSSPLRAELREIGGATVFFVDAPADRWPLGGSGAKSDPYLRERANATWGWWNIPAATLRSGIEYELILSSPTDTEYRAVGLRYGSSPMPGGFLPAPGAEKSSNGGASWEMWEASDPTAHLSFFLRTQ